MLSIAMTFLGLRIALVGAAVRLVKPEELEVANGEDSDHLWLAVGGKVYNVKKGQEFYGADGSYHVFAGRDSLVPYVTGVFTPEEAAKSWKDLEPQKLPQLNHWVEFYDKEDKYPLVGYFVGKFYDEKGKPTEENIRFHEELILQTELEKIEKERKKAEKKKAKAEKDKAEAEKKKAQAEQEAEL